MNSFVIINNNNKIVFSTSYMECIPSKTEVDTMLKMGYKIKIDNIVATKKKIAEFYGGK